MTNERQRRRSCVPRAALLFIFLSFLAPALSAAGNGCVGGGRPRPDEGGIGGTGIQSMRPDDEGGIGGTGISAGAETGIIGTVTGFGSICVGGIEIHYGADSPVQIDGQPGTAQQLAVGQVVEVVATGSGTELQAQRIAMRHVVSGPVTRVDVQHNEIEVIGQRVSLSPVTRGADPESTATATALPPESYVQVSGMRRDDGVVVASRASRVEPRDLAQVVGPVTKLGSGMLWVAGTAVRTASPTALSVGDEVYAVGHWDGAAIVAGSIAAVPRLPFDGRVARVDIEGFARLAPAGQLQVGPFTVEVPPATAQDVRRLSGLETRIRIQAVIQNRHVIVERIGVMDELPSLPPLSPRDVGASTGGKPGDGRSAIGAPASDPSRPGEGGGPPPHNGWKPDGSGGGVAPPGAVWNDRPPPAQLPERSGLPENPDRPPPPQLPDRPAVPHMPDRPPVPHPPDRPQLPQRPDRPARPDRPSLPVRPEVSGRP